MPVKKCNEGGKSVWKWGDEGKFYIGPNGKQDAIKQGISIEGDKFEDSYDDYPKQASENAKVALRWAEENVWDSCHSQAVTIP